MVDREALFLSNFLRHTFRDVFYFSNKRKSFKQTLSDRMKSIENVPMNDSLPLSRSLDRARPPQWYMISSCEEAPDRMRLEGIALIHHLPSRPSGATWKLNLGDDAVEDEKEILHRLDAVSKSCAWMHSSKYDCAVIAQCLNGLVRKANTSLGRPSSWCSDMQMKINGKIFIGLWPFRGNRWQQVGVNFQPVPPLMSHTLSRKTNKQADFLRNFTRFPERPVSPPQQH